MKLLLATDGSPESMAACQLVKRIPLPAGSAIHVLSAIHLQPLVSVDHAVWQSAEFLLEHQTEWAKQAVAEAEKELRLAAEWVRPPRRPRHGLSVTGSTPCGEPAAEILAFADAMDADLVVVGSRGLTGIEEFLLGSVARRVAKLSPRPVLVARALRDQLRETIVAIDGSEHASHAVRFAATLPLPEGSGITLTHVVRPPHSFLRAARSPRYAEEITELQRQQEAAGQKLLETAREILATPDRPVGTELRVGEPAAEISRLAEERGADLIVAGARGVSLIEGLRMGSVADRLLKHAPCSVLIVH